MDEGRILELEAKLRDMEIETTMWYERWYDVIAELERLKAHSRQEKDVSSSKENK